MYNKTLHPFETLDTVDTKLSKHIKRKPSGILMLSRPHIRRFCRAITLSGDKSLNVSYLPTRFHRCRRQKSASGKSLPCQTFIGRYCLQTVKLPGVMLEATLSGDVLQFLHYLKC